MEKHDKKEDLSTPLEMTCEGCGHHGHEHEAHEHGHHHHEHDTREAVIKIAVATVLLIAAAVTEHFTSLPKWAYLLIYMVPYLVVGWDTLKEAAEGLLHGEALSEDFLMSVATLGALGIGFMPGAETQFPEAVFVMLFFQVGELFEGIAEGRSRKSISHLLSIRPDVAHVERPAGTHPERPSGTHVEPTSTPIQESTSAPIQEPTSAPSQNPHTTSTQLADVHPSEIALGEVIVIRPGEKVPLDGTVIEGESSIDTVALTGESVPRNIHAGEEILSGCVNLSGVLRVRTTKAFGQDTASKILEMVEDATENKSRSESFITRFAKIYTPIVVGLAVIVAIVPSLISGEWATWIYRALLFLVVSCPCALVISVPLSFFGGLGGASRKGILIKGSNLMDTLAKLRTVVFDKTGTLTEGVFEVTAVHPDIDSETELLHLAAHVERHSTHPVAMALRNAYPNEADDCEISGTREIAGQGIVASVNGRRVAVGNAKLMEEEGAAWRPCHHSGTIVHVAIDREYAGHIVISDREKADAAEAIRALKEFAAPRMPKLGTDAALPMPNPGTATARRSIRTVMLTGDNEGVAAAVATSLGLDEYHAGLLPADKVAQVERLLPDGPLAFVGDGINDAPVLARADVGIAMGALGSDAAIEAADVVLMDDKPSRISEAIRISRRTIGIATQNIWFAVGVKVLVLVLATLGLATMWMAVFADVGVTVLAVLNAMRALKN